MLYFYVPVELSSESNVSSLFLEDRDGSIIIGPHWKIIDSQLGQEIVLQDKCPGPLKLIIATSHPERTYTATPIKIDLRCDHCGYRQPAWDYFWLKGYSEIARAVCRWIVCTEARQKHTSFGSSNVFEIEGQALYGLNIKIFIGRNPIYLILMPQTIPKAHQILHDAAWKIMFDLQKKIADADKKCRTTKKEILGF